MKRTAPTAAADFTAARRRLEEAIERLLALLDLIDGDTDVEDGADAEPWLGWLSRDSGVTFFGGTHDLEADHKIEAEELP